MAGYGRLDRIRKWLTERRHEVSRGGEKGADQPGPAPGRDPDEVGADSGFERPALGDLGETRREAIGRRLSGLRSRLSSRGRSGEGRVLASAGDRLASAGRGLLGGLRTGAAAASDLWFGLSLPVRQRLAALALLLAGAVLVFGVIAPLAPCWAPGGDRCPPDDDAAFLVPADVGAYVHLNLDPDTDQYEAAAELAPLLPDLTSEAAGLLSVAAERRIVYRRDVQPWSAGELALALAPDGLETGRLLLIEVADAEGAAAFADRILGPGVTESELNGTTVKTDREGLSASIAEGFLLIGPEAGVRRSIELPAGNSIAADPPAQRVLDALPDQRLLDAVASPDLLRALSAAGTLGPFDTFVNARGAEVVAAALGFEEGALDVSVRSIQDEEVADQEPDFFAALPLFEPALTERVGADALVYLGVGDPGSGAARLADQAVDTAPDLFRGLRSFSRRLRSREGVDVEQDLLPLLEGEAALTVEPETLAGERPAEPASPGAVAPTGIPYLALLATDVDSESGARELAQLQVPLAAAVDPASEQPPVFETREIGGVEAYSLRLSRVVDLTYATYDEQLVVGTRPAAVERARAGGESLAGSEEFERATDGFPEQLSMLLYFDFRGLLTLGERLFLAEDPDYVRFAQDLRTLDAIAIAIRRTRSELATDARITVAGERRAAFGVDPIPAPSG
jgi:hypothetical protein